MNSFSFVIIDDTYIYTINNIKQYANIDTFDECWCSFIGNDTHRCTLHLISIYLCIQRSFNTNQYGIDIDQWSVAIWLTNGSQVCGSVMMGIIRCNWYLLIICCGINGIGQWSVLSFYQVCLLCHFNWSYSGIGLLNNLIY